MHRPCTAVGYRPLLALLAVLAIVPPGISSSMWLLLLLCLDRSDEYQMVNYLLWYKVLAFIKLGLIPVVAGYFDFYTCVQSGDCLRSRSATDLAHQLATDGEAAGALGRAPGIDDTSQVQLLLFFLVTLCAYGVFLRCVT